MTAMENLQAIPKALEILRQEKIAAGPVLSAYLDTSLGRIDKRAYLIAYRDRRKELGATIPETERDLFETAADQIDGYLTGELDPRAPGLALFAGGTADSFVAVPLPVRPVEAVVWDRHPLVAPLIAVLDDYERIAIVLFDSRRARLFRIHLGAIEAQQTIDDDVPEKQQSGGWAALQQSRYARHRDDHLSRHAKRTTAVLAGWLRVKPFDRLFVAGPAEPLSVLKLRLSRPLRDRLVGTLSLELSAGDADVLGAVSRAQAVAERQGELALVEELIEAATGNTALGIEPVLAALSDGRVHGLLVADSLDAVGAECPSCGSLSRWAERCPACDAALTRVDDLRERAIEHALSQGAKVEVVAGAAAERLLAHGGLAAWTRY